MSDIHLLVQRWFVDGEGWAYDSNIPAELRLKAVREIANVAAQYLGKEIQLTRPLEVGNYRLWVLIRKDVNCPDEKAASRLPHIDIGVLVPKELEVNSDLILRYFRFAQEKIHHRGVFEPVSFFEMENPQKKGCSWGCILISICLLVGIIFGTWVGLVNPATKDRPGTTDGPGPTSGSNGGTGVIPPEEPNEQPVEPQPPVPEPVEPPKPAMIDVSSSKETKILGRWNLRCLKGTNDHNRLRKFIEFIQNPAELLSDPTISGSRHPEVVFLRLFPQTFPDLKENELPEKEYQSLIAQICAAFGVSRFEEIQNRLPNFEEYCAALTKVELDQPTSGDVRLFIERYAGELINCDSLEETKRLKEWRLPILADVINDKERLNAFIVRVINQPHELRKGFEQSRNPEAQFLGKFPEQVVTTIQGKATRWEFEAKIREICRAFGVNKFHEIPDALPNFRKVCEDIPLETLREPISDPIHAFVLNWLDDAPDFQQETAKLLNPQKREECRKVPWLVVAEYFDDLQPGCIKVEEAFRLSSDERKLVEKLKDLGEQKKWKFSGTKFGEIRKEYDTIQKVYDRIEKNRGRK